MNSGQVNTIMKASYIILFCSTLLSMLLNSIAVDTIRANQSIRYGETIVSGGGEFELGFFSPGGSTNRYVGIWYKKISNGTVVWVANREVPLTNNSGVLKVTGKALILFSGSNSTIWSSNSSRFVKNPMAQLLDTGNLVLRDENDNDPDNFIWQSFDYPVDTLLPGMKVGFNLITGLEWYCTSWKSDDDPSRGSFTNRLDLSGYPQLFYLKDSVLKSRTGPWVGNRFSGNPIPKPSSIYKNEFFMNQKEIYYTFHLVDKSSRSAFTRLILTQNGGTQRLIWNDDEQEWVTYVTLQLSDCDRYGLCGAYGVCNIDNTPRCECLRGFDPKFPEKWESADWSDGCIRTRSLDCGNGDGFKKYSGVKLPDTRHSWYNTSMNIEECRNLCLKNCSCTAYSNIDIRNDGSGCLLWFEDLMDIKGYTEDGQDIYLRMPASELDESKSTRNRVKRFILIPIVSAVLLALFLCVVTKRKTKSKGRSMSRSKSIAANGNEGEDLELPFFDLVTIENATNYFSHDNKLGEGGFGSVYKGMLEDGQEIAVKRLSENSRQGIDEFKNEVSCIGKLQHRNLVSLLGCCIEEGERILIYEYMPNKSLDTFIFDKEINKSLDWPKRFNIINGIARGLLYLHQDSKLRIIHRDLKTSNILLDHEMNPKISDFGMARIFGGSQTEANTTRVVGTYGYMPPEYAIDGLFSTKSDVYSFGVLVLEIITGQKNRCFEHPDHNLNLIGHAWRSFNEDKLLELIDRAILESNNQNEVCRVIQIGLLCVQEYPEDRPNMSSVVLMLNSKTVLPPPKQPGFFTERKRHEAERLSSRPMLSSSNDYTVTIVAPR